MPRTSIPILFSRHILFNRSSRWTLLLGLLVLAIQSLRVGFDLFSKTTIEFHPPKNSPSDIATRKLIESFREIAMESLVTTVLVESLVDGLEEAKSDAKEFDEELESLLRRQFKGRLVYQSFFSLQEMGLGEYAKARFAISNATNARFTMMIRTGLLKAPEGEKNLGDGPRFSNSSMQRISASSDEDVDGWVDFVETAVELLGRKTYLPTGKYFVGATGPAIFSKDVRRSTETDVFFIDSTTLCLAMVALALVLRSFRLLILPMLSIIAVVSVSLYIVYVLQENDFVRVTSLVPSIMTSSCVAFSIDYSLFLLSRFREEIRSGRNLEQAIERTLETAGHTVLVSGLTLACCWFLLVSFKVDFIRSVGVGAGVALTTCVVINLLLIPAMLVQFSDFFLDSFFSFKSWKRLFRRLQRRMMRSLRMCGSCIFHIVKGDTQAISILLAASPASPRLNSFSQHSSTTTSPLLSSFVDELSLPELRVAQGSRAEDFMPPPPTGGSGADDRIVVSLIENIAQVREEMRLVEANARRTFKVARFVTDSRPRACLIVAFVFVCLIPFAFLAWGYEHSNSYLLTIPRGAKGTQAFIRFEDAFGHGRLNPNHLIIKRVSPVPAGKTAETEMKKMFEFVQNRIIRDVLFRPIDEKSTDVLVKDVESGVWLFGKPVPFRDFVRCAQEAHLKDPSALNEYCKSVMFVGRFTVKEAAICLNVELNVEPNSERGGEWLTAIRHALVRLTIDTELDGMHAYEFYLAGGDTIIHDVVESVYKEFPVCVALTTVVVFSLIALAFRSVVVPIRAVSSICATLCFVYGSGVLVYQHGMLEFTNLAGLSSPTREIHWVSVVMLFAVLVGVSLDYDTFTLTRVLEYRSAGFSDCDSVRAGIASSFKIVTTAGLIMAVAFSGLLFSRLPVLNQISFFLVTAVLFDTFIVRLVLAPALMILLGRWNWWPRNEPSKWDTQS